MKPLTPLLVLLYTAGVSGQTTRATGRFDVLVRTDFFAGFAGDQARLQRAMDRCGRALSENPRHVKPSCGTAED